jgi:hypothetical protein
MSVNRAGTDHPRVVVGLGLRSALRAPQGYAPAKAHDGMQPQHQRQPHEKTKPEKANSRKSKLKKGTLLIGEAWGHFYPGLTKMENLIDIENGRRYTLGTISVP